MTHRFYHIPLATLLLGLSGCGAQAPPVPVKSPPLTAPHELLGHLVERYWDESAAASPWYSWGAMETRYAEAPADTLTAQALADSLALERRYLNDLKGVSRSALDAEGQTTYDLFLRERELTVESFTFPSELLPVNPYDSTPQRFALMSAAAERYALRSERDFDVWQARVRVYGRWTEQAIFNLRAGMRRGYTLPLAVVSRTLPVLAALAEDAPSNVFYQPLRPAAGSDPPERARLVGEITKVVKEQILPSYRQLHDFMQREYLPQARNSIGLSALPLGQAWYAHLAKRATDVTRSPAELHAAGVAAVERLHVRLQALAAESGFAGNLQGFIDSLRNDPRLLARTADETLNAYQEMKPQVATAAATLLGAAPRADFDIHGVEAFRAATVSELTYRRSMASGKIPAVLYINTADLDKRSRPGSTARYLREAVPGHHYQLALQQERADLPRFRRFGGAPAFIDGWGLYAASLGEELGLYRNADDKFGALLAQLECAVGVVIDTGVHAQNWSRVQALDYLHAHLPVDDVAAALFVDRVLALPGDALSCMAGFTKLQALRARAQQALGTRFDVQAFHMALLRNGSMPLDILDSEMTRWAAEFTKQQSVAPLVEAPAATTAQ